MNSAFNTLNNRTDLMSNEVGVVGNDAVAELQAHNTKAHIEAVQDVLAQAEQYMLLSCAQFTETKDPTLNAMFAGYSGVDPIQKVHAVFKLDDEGHSWQGLRDILDKILIGGCDWGSLKTPEPFFCVLACLLYKEMVAWSKQPSDEIDLEHGQSLLHELGFCSGMSVGYAAATHQRSKAHGKGFSTLAASTAFKSRQSTSRATATKHQHVLSVEDRRKMTIRLWLKNNPKTGKKWRTMTSCAEAIFNHPEVDAKFRTVYSWISDYEKERERVQNTTQAVTH